MLTPTFLKDLPKHSVSWYSSPNYSYSHSVRHESQGDDNEHSNDIFLCPLLHSYAKYKNIRLTTGDAFLLAHLLL